MRPMTRPLAFVDEGGYIIPNPTFTNESLKHIKGRFIYTKADLDEAIVAMNRKQDERRQLADSHFGAEAVRAPADFEVIGDVIDDMSGTRETIPSFTASPTRKRQSGGASKKLAQPNYSPLPESMHQDSPVDSDEPIMGIDTSGAVQAMFGK